MPKIKDYTFSIGADPEIFVKRGGELVSAYGLVPGTKEKPFKVNRGAVQVDGMALEFNIDPSESWPTFNANLNAVMRSLKDMVPGFDFYESPVAMFGEAMIDRQPMAAKMLGCDPDFNAYTGAVNPVPDGSKGFRTASGHVHVGWCNGVEPTHPEHYKSCTVLVRALDLYVGLPSLLFPLTVNHLAGEQVVDPEHDKLRRSLYGKAGAFRPKHYGVEYRTLSNLWLKDESLRKLVYYNTIKAIEACFNNDRFVDGHSEEIEKTINDSDIKRAVEIMEYYDVPSPRYYREN